MLHVENKETRGRKLIVDEQLKACPECKRIWEKISKRHYTRSYTIYPFGIIPRIGKEKKTCPQCSAAPKKLSHACKSTANVFDGAAQKAREEIG